MANYCIDIREKLIEIFREHCNLTCEEFEEIEGRLIDIETGIQEDQAYADTESEAEELSVIFEFLYNTKQLTIEEYNGLCNMANSMRDEAQKLAEGA